MVLVGSISSIAIIALLSVIVHELSSRMFSNSESR